MRDNPSMRRALLIAFAFGLAAGAQETRIPDLTAEQILQKAIDATGGAAAREKIKSVVMKGEFELAGQGVRSTLEIYSKAPNKRLSVTKIEGFGEMKQGFDGQNAWVQDPQGNIRDVTGPQLTLMQREGQFNADLKWKELYEKVEVQGKEKVEGKDAYVLKLTPKTGPPVVRYYDAAAYLLVRSDLSVNTPQGEFTLKSVLSDYRDVDGAKMPFQMTQQMPMGTMTTRITEAKTNLPIDDQVFAKPGGAPK